MLVHPEEAIELFIYDLHYMFGDNLPLEVLQECLRLLLLLVLLIRKVLLETFIYLLKLLLGLGLVSTEVVLLLQFVPDLQLIHKVCEQAIHLIKAGRQIRFLENLLDLMPRDVQQKFVGIDILGEGETGQKHVHKTLHSVEVEVALQEFQICDELLILRDLEALEVLLLQELKDHSLLGI